MKTKDIVTIVVCALVIGGAAFFGIKTFMPAKSTIAPKDSQTAITTGNTITGNIDQETLDRIKTLKNYGDTNLNDIGRVNPFAPLN